MSRAHPKFSQWHSGSLNRPSQAGEAPQGAKQEDLPLRDERQKGQLKTVFKPAVKPPQGGTVKKGQMMKVCR